MSPARTRLLTVLLIFAATTGASCQPTFDAPVTYPLAQEAQTIAIGDLNGDGRDDVAVTAWPSSLYVLYQQPDGTLCSPYPLYAPNSPLAIAIGDVNGDGRKDLAVGGSNGSILLYYEQADGTFGLPDSGWGYGLVNSLVIDDFNNDGRADIASTSAYTPTVIVQLQADDGTFALPASYWIGGYNARCLCSLDYNSDGIRDLALLTDDATCYLAGTLSGNFGKPNCVSTPWAYALAAGDVTNDGRDDLAFTVATNQPDAAVGVIPQSTGGVLGPVQYYPAYDFAQPLAIADLDKDGRNDIIMAHGGYEAVTALYQADGGTFGQWNRYEAPYCNRYQPGGIAVGDLNSDGLPDVAVADWWKGVVILLQKTTFKAPDTTAPVCIADVTGTAGREGWYVSPVTVTLTAEDNVGGSGLGDIFCTRDGVTWASYTAPLMISADGLTTISFYATDKTGNKSAVQEINLKLDKTPPVVSLTPETTELWPPNGGTVGVAVAVQAADSISGVSSLHLLVLDEYGLAQPQFDVTPGSVVTVPLVASRNDTDLDGRRYTLVLTCTDAAGNASRATAQVTVPHSKPEKPPKEKKSK